MRPRIVVVSLVVAVGLVLLAAVMKQVIGSGGSAQSSAAEQVPDNGKTSRESNPPNPESVTNSALVAELRVKDTSKELDEIRQLEGEGSQNPHAGGMLLGKVTHKEPEVRTAAIAALIQLNDTNVIPGLEEAIALVDDPRDKVAIKDAIDYLKLPSVMPDEPPPDFDKIYDPARKSTNRTNVRINPRFQQGVKKSVRKGMKMGDPGRADAGSPDTSNPGQPQVIPPASTPNVLAPQ